MGEGQTMSTTSLTPTSATPDTPKLLKKASAGEMKTPISPTQTSFGCQHIKSLLQAAREHATSGYTRLIQCLKNESNTTDRMYTKAGGANATAGTTYFCLQCPNISGVRERHRKDHPFAVESNAGFIFCHACKDFVYDPTFEEIRSGNTSKKRKHAALTDSEKRLVANNSTITPCAATGLRGLYNMGQTCFMSVILQALIHNPIIRAFYMAEGHRKEDCERDACTSCALDDIFNDFFASEKHEGYGAVHMLQGCWKGGGGLAGYSQQDAHEYLGFILNSLHAANTATDEDDDDENSNSSQQDKSFASKGDTCDCIVHQTFGGQLRSTVTCSSCKTTTTALDPFMDLSLDVRSAAVAAAISNKKAKLKLANGNLTTAKEATAPMDLFECLDRFTSAETLGSDSYFCRKCSGSQTATKKLSLSRLPPVVPIHLKRFSHSKTSSTSSKVETQIRFPFDLDLTPYTSSSSSKSKNKEEEKKVVNGENKPKPADEPPAAGWPKPIYGLSSVIVHKGKMDNGHYISYSRQGDDWFRFDDSMVVQVDEKEVLGAEAYMLFYVIHELAVADD